MCRICFGPGLGRNRAEKVTFLCDGTTARLLCSEFGTSTSYSAYDTDTRMPSESLPLISIRIATYVYIKHR